jgi:hypothetical protein
MPPGRAAVPNAGKPGPILPPKDGEMKFPRRTTAGCATGAAARANLVIGTAVTGFEVGTAIEERTLNQPVCPQGPTYRQLLGEALVETYPNFFGPLAEFFDGWGRGDD